MASEASATITSLVMNIHSYELGLVLGCMLAMAFFFVFAVTIKL
ncbi:hypothetical protein FACS1894208_10330 [Clostridia bacterium]|nr:hypothetical protein FACS1894208_10330 [Clostridia bacterium]